MELLKKIQELVNFLLRYVVAGGSAVLVFGLTQHDPFSFLRVGAELSPVLVLLFVSVIGPAIYSIHRAALHPVILIPMFIVLSRAKQLKIDMTAIGFKWWELDRKLAESKEKWRTDNSYSGLLSTYEGWAAQVHYLYCSAFGAAFALAIAYFFNPRADHIKPILITSLVLFVAAVISDWRVTSWQVKRTKEIAASKLTSK